MTTPPKAGQTMATLNDNPMGQVSGTLPAKLETESQRTLTDCSKLWFCCNMLFLSGISASSEGGFRNLSLAYTPRMYEIGS